jgi:hypothetical protein
LPQTLTFYIQFQGIKIGRRGGKMKVNTRLLPIKAHYFFSCAGLSPILPYMPVFAKQLGISSVTDPGCLSRIQIFIHSGSNNNTKRGGVKKFVCSSFACR